MWSIWTFAFGYFAAYVPYAAMTKAISSGMLEPAIPRMSGTAMLPLTIATSTLGMVLFLGLSGLWRHARRFELGGVSLPRPSLPTLLSGIGTAAIIATTTLAYTFDMSIVFAQLLMRGGVLIVAPVVDLLGKRKVRWFSWVGFGFSVLAVIIPFLKDARISMPAMAALNFGIYIFAYFVRLRLMTRFGKSSEDNAQVRYFVEEQLVATPMILVTIFGLSFLPGQFGAELTTGFAMITHPGEMAAALPTLLMLVAIGLCSQGTGIFGGLVLLDKSENTYAVPVNRASSVLAGVIAAGGLAYFYGDSMDAYELGGAAAIMAAIVVLSFAPMIERRRARAIQ
jgi:hypothetical protein